MPSPIAHSVMGLAIAEASMRPSFRRRWGPAAWLVVCANLPDFDFIPGVLMGDPFLLHRGASHSIGCAAAVGAAVYVAMRALKNRHALRWSLLSTLGVLSHLILDYFSEPGGGIAGVPFFWPFDRAYLVSPSPVFGPMHAGAYGRVFSWANAIVGMREAALLGALLVAVKISKQLPSLLSRLRALRRLSAGPVTLIGGGAEHMRPTQGPSEV